MTFQERVKRLEEYRPDISFKDGAFVLKLRFKPSWRIIQPNDPEKLACAEDNKTKGLWWYVVKIEEIDELFDLIDATIEANIEMERKSELYQAKVEELKELFLSDASFEKLSSLQFTFPKPKKGKSAKAKPEAEKTAAPAADAIEVKPVEPESEIDRKISKAIRNKTAK